MTALRDLPVAVARVDGALTVLDASRACLRLFGVAAGVPAVDLGGALSAAPDLGDELALATARLTRPGEEVLFEWCRQDRVYEVRVSAGDGGSFYVLFHDATDSRGLEEIQLEARHYLEQVLADVPSGVAVLDERLRITFANRGALDLLARIGGTGQLADVIGADPTALVAGEAGARWRDLCARVRDSGERADGQRESFALDPPLVLAVAAHPLHDRRGGRTGALLVLDDITERARLEGELIRMEKLATVGQMVITVNHEINNPLTIISTNAQAARLLNRNLDDKTRAKLLAIEEQVKRISAVTERLRTMDAVVENAYIADGPKMIDISMEASDR